MDQHQQDRGRNAVRPYHFNRHAWRDILLRLWQEQNRDNLSMVAAGVAFYTFLAVFPAVAALVSIYGLVADPTQIQDHFASLATVLPGEARDVLMRQFATVASHPSQQLSLRLVFSLALTLWSSASGIKAMIGAINIAYEERGSRSFIAENALALALTLGGIIFLLVAISLVVIVPAVIAFLHLQTVMATIASLARWPVLAALVALAVSVLYRMAPLRRPAQWHWLSWGAGVATVLWLIVSYGFSAYVSHFGSYDKMYGSVGAVVVLMFWFYLTAYIVLLGAELNAEMEHQTARDTTVGPGERPMGERGAHVADEIAPTP